MNNVTKLVEPGHQTEFYFQWHITDKCNLRCKHCYHDNYANEGLGVSQLLKIGSHLCDAIKKWKKIGSFSITGGEPFSRKEDVFQLLNLLENRDEISHVDILTNGTLIDDRIIENLLKYKKLRRLQLSLEGLQETNDHIRGEGSFDLITEKIKRLNEKGLTTAVMMTIGNHNKDEVIPLAEKLGDMGVEAFLLDRFIPEGQSEELKKWVLTSEELKEVYEKSYGFFQRTEPLRGTLSHHQLTPLTHLVC